MSSEATISSVAKCPRCGYDLRGAVATWIERCPLVGTCTECGLDFEWADLLSEKLYRPSLCVEYARSWKALPITSLRTLLMMFLPWRFWSQLKMPHELRPRALAAFCLVLLALLYVSFGITQGVAVSRAISPSVSNWQRVFSTAYAVVLPLSSDPPSQYYVATGWGPAGTLPTPLWVTARHFDRIGSHSDFSIALLTGNVDGIFGTGTFRLAIRFLLTSLLMFLCTPIGFLLLPISRRRAKVRWSHIVRITVYSLVLFVYLFMYALLRFGFLRDYWWVSAGPLYRELQHLVLWVTPLLLLIWWSFAISRYLKMSHAWGVGLAIVVMGVLSGAALTLLMI